MRVEATDKGFYHNTYINPGDVFTLSDLSHFSSHWMKKVDDSVPATKTLYGSGGTGGSGYTGPTPNQPDHKPAA
jgi:hypothetical protein